MQIKVLKMFKKNIWMHSLFSALGNRLAESEAYGITPGELEGIFTYKHDGGIISREDAVKFYGEKSIIYSEKKAGEAFLLACTIADVFEIEYDDLPFKHEDVEDTVWLEILRFGREVAYEWQMELMSKSEREKYN